jgi:hypothetical protein
MRPASADVREGVRAALVDAGCQKDIAARLAEETTCERSGDEDFVWLLGISASIPADGDEYAFVVLAENVAAENAEACDRSARGESGYTPFWPLPGRKPRR